MLLCIFPLECIEPCVTKYKFSYAQEPLTLPENRHFPNHKAIFFLLTKVTYSFLFFYENKPFLKYSGFFFEYVNCYFNRSLLKHLKRNLSHAFLKLLIYAVLSFVPKEMADPVSSLLLKKMSDHPLYCYILSQTELLESFRMIHDLLCKLSWGTLIFFLSRSC